MVEYQPKKKLVTYGVGGDGLLDVVNFVPAFDPSRGFRERNVETSISDPASWQRYMKGYGSKNK